MLIAVRAFLCLALDDLLVLAREFLTPQLSRFGLHRMLKRGEMPTLVELARQDADGDKTPRQKPFKDYQPWHMHIDIKHLPRMSDGQQKCYLFVAIGQVDLLDVSGNQKQPVREGRTSIHETNGREGIFQGSDGAHG